MDYAALKAEINADAALTPYVSAGNHEAIARALNVKSVTITRKLVPVSEAKAAIVPDEYGGLTAANRLKVDLQFLGAADVDISSPNVRLAFQTFGAATTTRANLLALQSKTTTRAEAFGPVRHEDVLIALRDF